MPSRPQGMRPIGANRDGRREEIGDPGKLETGSSDVQPSRENAAEQSTEEREAAFQDRKDSPGLTEIFGWVVLRDIVETSPEQASNQNPKDEILNPRGGDLVACCPASRERAADRERSRPPDPRTN